MGEENTLIVLVIIIIVYIYLYKQHHIYQENWEVYKQKPYGHIKTGSEPMNYYVQKRYRKPYRYPFQFMKTAPFNHLSHLD
jgi:hypothetical protein